MTVIKNAKIVLCDSIMDGCLVLDNGKITTVSEYCPEKADEIIDVHGNYVSPGFIDMHTHGAGGHDFMDGTVEAMKEACRMQMQHGATSISPTTLTCTNEELLNVFRVYKTAQKNWNELPNLVGLHLEGPFFSAKQAGAQDPKYLQLPLKENFMPILEAGEGLIARMSVAVELEGAKELGRELTKRGIVAAIGHSDAVYSEVQSAVDAGYTLVTHLYSGMSSLHRVGPYRVLGVVESAYLLDELKVEIIADGKHLPPELLRLIVKNKGVENISLVTDSMRGAGLPEGQRVKLGSLTNGQETILKDGVAMMPDFKAFAGSICTADRCVRTMYQLAGVTLPQAVRMMTENPAKHLKVDDRKGKIQTGYDADLCVFDENINIKAVCIGGEMTVNLL